MKQNIDARGKACPLPVIETKKMIETLHVGDSVEVAVDNSIAVQNIAKMAEQKRLLVVSEKVSEQHYVVTLTVTETDKEDGQTIIKDCTLPQQQTEKVVVVLGSDKMGEGDEKLGHILMKGFIYALTEQERLPDTILLYNRGVYLSTETSESITDLKFLASQGVEVLSCGTCLNHYSLSEKLAVGSVTNMYVILEKQLQATKLIRP